ncbi:hypothetical protein [Kutzneria kofuensis]|uniref:EF-hand domain-containing protein n=1 Tax=Kutzneria kofuensis TaxID=103725 RepID=A0A7W9KMW9_9PSEU|nr:hypothetical protein [Kutzneria kofuensis]MBB5895499.1 hypothetical protein [Kutzneria kofuensis]
MDSFPTGSKGSGRGRAVITASSSMEYAFEGDELADDRAPTPSVFTSALVEGLRTGEADLDGDGLVSLDELYDYVYDRVRERNPAQTPTKDIEMSGDLYLARSRRRARLPDDLLAALAAPNLFTRVGAVRGLRELLLGTDVRLATVARKELDRIAGSDVPQVAEAARAALRELVVVPSTRVIELTGARPSWLLRLDGPPLARVGGWQVTDPRIMVRPVADGLEVSVDPAHSLRGEITVAGLEIHVVATGAAHTHPASVPRPVKIRPAQPAWTWRTVVPAAFALASVMLGLNGWADLPEANSTFEYEVLAYVGLRLIESFATGVGAARQRWIWGLCGIGTLAGVWGLIVHGPGFVVLFWLVAAGVEIFGRPVDRVRAVLAAVVAVPSTVLVFTVDSNSHAGQLVFVLNGALAILLGVVTLAPVLLRLIR